MVNSIGNICSSVPYSSSSASSSSSMGGRSVVDLTGSESDLPMRPQGVSRGSPVQRTHPPSLPPATSIQEKVDRLLLVAPKKIDRKELGDLFEFLIKWDPFLGGKEPVFPILYHFLSNSHYDHSMNLFDFYILSFRDLIAYNIRRFDPNCDPEVLNYISGTMGNWVLSKKIDKIKKGDSSPLNPLEQKAFSLVIDAANFPGSPSFQGIIRMNIGNYFLCTKERDTASFWFRQALQVLPSSFTAQRCLSYLGLALSSDLSVEENRGLVSQSLKDALLLYDGISQEMQGRVLYTYLEFFSRQNDLGAITEALRYFPGWLSSVGFSNAASSSSSELIPDDSSSSSPMVSGKNEAEHPESEIIRFIEQMKELGPVQYRDAIVTHLHEWLKIIEKFLPRG